MTSYIYILFHLLLLLPSPKTGFEGESDQHLLAMGSEYVGPGLQHELGLPQLEKLSAKVCLIVSS